MRRCPRADVPRSPRPTVGQLLRTYRWAVPEPCSADHARHLQHARQVLAELALCRTAALGGQLWTCPQCAQPHYQLHACRNRHCPACGETTRDRWLQRMLARALPIDYAHVVFTVPHELNALFAANAAALHGLLLRTAWQTLDAYARRVHGARLGGVFTLHTWGQRLTEHFHVHGIVTLEGLALDGTRWVAGRDRHALLGVPTLAARYRDRLLAGLRALVAAGRLWTPPERRGPAAWERWLTPLARRRWVVNVQLPPAGCPGPEAALRYLGRYVQGMAISNQRLLSDQQGVVAFQVKDYRHGRRRTVVRLPGEEFVGRLARHVLPPRFMRVRHCGLFANAAAGSALALARIFLHAPPPPARDAPRSPTLLDAEPELRAPRCRACGDVAMEWTAELEPTVAWARRRYGHYASAVVGAGFAAPALRVPAPRPP